MLKSRELKALSYIAGYQAVHGYPPSLPELGDALGYKSRSSVSAFVAKLARKGVVTLEANKSRTLRLACVERGGVRVPLVSVCGEGANNNG